MPPFGLYPLSRQHLYGSSSALSHPTVRPTFNTMNFRDDELEPTQAVIEKATLTMNDMANFERKNDVKVKNDDNKKEKQLLSAEDEQERGIMKAINAASVDAAMSTMPSANWKKNKDKREKKKRKGKGNNDAQISARKRKRDSGIKAESPSLRDEGHTNSFVVGTDMLRKIETSIGDLRANFNQIQEPETLTKKSSKMKKKKINSRRKSEPHDIDAAQAKADGGLAKTYNGPSPAKALAKNKKKRKDKKNKMRQSLLVTEAITHNNVPEASSPYASPPKKTPVPLPQQSSPYISTFTTSPHEGDGFEVLVTETPLSRPSYKVTNTQTAPITFNLSQPAGELARREKSEKVRTILLSSPVSTESGQPPATVSKLGNKMNQASLTGSNLQRYIRSLNDQPKVHLRGPDASVSTASSMSSKGVFAHKGKLSPSPSTHIHLMFPSNLRDKDQSATHEEPNAQAFDKIFHASQGTVDFTRERQYLHDRLTWRAQNDAAGPLHCLKTATGCTSKSEQIIRLMKEDKASTFRKVATSTEAATAAFETAVQATIEAEKFLHNAVMAHIPVPVGRLEGVYTLYCPKYAESHVDKYGFGQRKLSISQPSGFTSNTYTARLSIPPRPMAYTILSFNPPPHASFRITTLTTCAEGYSMDLIVLGSGYILLRVDLALLLTGKKTDVNEDVCMEFVGIKQRNAGSSGAVNWGTLKASVNATRKAKEMRKERADQERAEKEKLAMVESSPKKKRGRPTNAEITKRTLEKEQDGA